MLALGVIAVAGSYATQRIAHIIHNRVVVGNVQTDRAVTAARRHGHHVTGARAATRSHSHDLSAGDSTRAPEREVIRPHPRDVLTEGHRKVHLRRTCRIGVLTPHRHHRRVIHAGTGDLDVVDTPVQIPIGVVIVPADFHITLAVHDRRQIQFDGTLRIHVLVPRYVLPRPTAHTNVYVPRSVPIPPRIPRRVEGVCELQDSVRVTREVEHRRHQRLVHTRKPCPVAVRNHERARPVRVRTPLGIRVGPRLAIGPAIDHLPVRRQTGSEVRFIYRDRRVIEHVAPIPILAPVPVVGFVRLGDIPIGVNHHPDVVVVVRVEQIARRNHQAGRSGMRGLGLQSVHVVGRRLARVVIRVAGINFECRVAAGIDVRVVRQVELHIERTSVSVSLIENLERSRGHADTEQIIWDDVETGTEHVDLGNDAVKSAHIGNRIAMRNDDVVGAAFARREPGESHIAASVSLPHPIIRAVPAGNADDATFQGSAVSRDLNCEVGADLSVDTSGVSDGQ